MDQKYKAYWDLMVWVIDGEATPEEEEKLRQWREEDPRHELFFRETEQFLKQLHAPGQMPVFDEEEGWKKFRQQQLFVPGRVSSVRRIVRYALAVAAIVVLFLGYMRFFDSAEQEVHIQPGSQKAILILDDGAKIAINNHPVHIKRGNAEIRNDSVSGLSFRETAGGRKEEITYSKLIIPQGGEYKLTLPDGTKVWLNAESELRFPSRFSGGKRVVEFSGEAYFEVAHQPACPFYVKTADMEVKVYGTEFNLNAYHDSPSIVATLVKGHVGVIPQGEKEVDILPSQQLILSKKDGKIDIREVDPELYISWRTGIYTFENASLEEIFSNIRRWYVFDVDYQEEELRAFRFTGDFQKDRPISYGLDLIRRTCEVNFKIQGNHILVTR